MSGKKPTKKLDPLYQLFEQYLLNRSYEDAQAFIKQLARDYMAYLDSTPAHVPVYLRESLLKDLESEAHEMLIKKMYGCGNITDHLNWGRVIDVKPDHTIFSFDLAPRHDSENTFEE